MFTQIILTAHYTISQHYFTALTALTALTAHWDKIASHCTLHYLTAHTTLSHCTLHYLTAHCTVLLHTALSHCTLHYLTAHYTLWLQTKPTDCARGWVAAAAGDGRGPQEALPADVLRHQVKKLAARKHPRSSRFVVTLEKRVFADYKVAEKNTGTQQGGA
jgi:hypothetical protein